MEKINIAELLKDCPKGMELDCTVFENLTFEEIDEVNSRILCNIQGNNGKLGISFNKFGCYSELNQAKCVIFPKGKTTWEGFVPPCQFKDADILYIYSTNPWICIYKEGGEKENVYYKYVAITSSSFAYDCDCFPLCHRNHVKEIRHATEEEKIKLFQAIKDNGYKWNTETKTLEKLPKFKVGDVIVDIYKKHLHCYSGSGKISQITDDIYIFTDGSYIHIQNQDNWELVPNKFDITTLKPFDSKVLVREKNTEEWRGHFFSHYDSNSDRPYVCIGVEGINEYKQCIPYKNNEHLLGTTNDCDEYYKTWK